MASIVAFCSLLVILSQGYQADAGTITTLATMRWESESSEFVLNNNTKYRMNETYTLIQLTSTTWTILQNDFSSNHLCFSKQKNVRVTLGNVQQSVIPLGFFRKWSCITELDISSQTITHVNHDDFKDAFGLVALNMSHNRITNIPSRTFELASNLTTIDLSHNLISRIEFNAFRDLKQLENLYLNKNLILSINTRYFSPGVTLILGYSAAEDILRQYSSVEIPSIQYLSIAFNPNLTFAPYLNASALSLSSTSITTLSLASTTRIIEAENCKIEIVEIPATNILQELFLANNRLISVENFTALTSLVILDVSFNYIETIDNSFLSNFPHLKALNVSNNKLVTFDQNISPHPIVLESLNVGHNYLKWFQLKQHCNQLRVLKIDNNNLTWIDTSIQQMTPALESLDLNDNNFTCSHLAKSLLSLTNEGVTLETLATSAAESDVWDYVIGIRCWNPIIERTRGMDAIEYIMMETVSAAKFVGKTVSQIKANIKNKWKQLKFW